MTIKLDSLFSGSAQAIKEAAAAAKAATDAAETAKYRTVPAFDVAHRDAQVQMERDATAKLIADMFKMSGPVQIEVGSPSQSLASKVTEQNKGLLKELLGFDLTPAKQQDPMVARKKSGPAIG